MDSFWGFHLGRNFGFLLADLKALDVLYMSTAAASHSSYAVHGTHLRNRLVDELSLLCGSHLL